MTSGAPQGPVFVGAPAPAPQNLADILERVLDKGVVIVGDIQVRLLDIELLTIKLRLMVASVDRAREMGINWWEGDPFVHAVDGGGDGDGQPAGVEDRGRRDRLEARLDALERRVVEGAPAASPQEEDRDGG